MSRRDHDGTPTPLGRPGGDWQGLRPTFDNPLTWALTVGRFGGITIRVHLVFLLFIVVMLLRAVFPSTNTTLAPTAWELTAIAMACLVIIVLAHELGHCLACRWMGGAADEILMWPLGGLAFCRPGHSWVAHFATALGGPAVNVLICLTAGGCLAALTGKVWGIAIPNPLTFEGLYDPTIERSFAHQTLFIVNATSLVLLLFNLLPVFPLDGGRIVQSSLWPRLGYSRSMVFAVRTGYVGALLMFIFGAVVMQWEVVGVALFGAVTCYITQRQMQETDRLMSDETDEYALTVHGGSIDAPAEGNAGSSVQQARLERQADRQAKREQQEAEEVDRILEKIAASGMDSLSWAERSLLQRATERRRRQ